MSKILKIKPRAGVLVPYPMSNKMLNKDGADVEKSSYWLRRIKDGDVIEIKPEPKQEIIKPKSKVKTKKETNKTGEKK